jgi:hypothetical protein
MPAQSEKISPSYCPNCQRLYRVTPPGYVCTYDSTPIIDIGDPLPPTRLQRFLPAGLTLTVVTMVGFGVVVF